MTIKGLHIVPSAMLCKMKQSLHTMKAMPGGSSSCSDGKNAGPFRLREL